jgi:hypothetical protein
MAQAAHRDISDPFLLEMRALLREEIDDQVCFHVAWTEAVDSNPLGTPLLGENK